MNQTYIHLLLSHLPIFGSILGGLVLIHGLWTKNNQTQIAAYNLFILSAIAASITYLTGEAAEETVENIQGIAKDMIEQHEEFAGLALASILILGLASIGGLILNLKKSPIAEKVALVILFISIISFGLMARTGYLGGQIRHTELNNITLTYEKSGGEVED